MKKIVILFLSFIFAFQLGYAQQGQVNVGAQVGVSMPLGDFSEVAKTGFGFLANFTYGIEQNFEIT